MGAIIQWVLTNWMQVVVSILAIDAALIPIFPNAGILGKIKDILSGIAPKQ